MCIKNAIAAGALLIFAATGCRTTFSPPSPSVLAPSEVRAMQTRTYDGLTQHLALKAVVDVLQDEGYIVDYGNTELGILHATRLGSFGGEIGFSTRQPLTEQFTPQFQVGPASFQATVNVTEYRTQTKIRVSLQRFVPTALAFFNAGGNSLPVFSQLSTAVVDAKTYQELFAKIDRGIFLQKQGL